MYHTHISIYNIYVLSFFVSVYNDLYSILMYISWFFCVFLRFQPVTGEKLTPAVALWRGGIAAGGHLTGTAAEVGLPSATWLRDFGEIPGSVKSVK